MSHIKNFLDYFIDFPLLLVTISANVLQLGEVADFEALTFNLALMFIRIPNVQISTEPAILPNCCYMPFFLGSLIIFLKKFT